MEKLKVAVVGAGLISRTKHLPALRNLAERVRIVGICDLDIDQAGRLAREFEADAAFGDPVEMFAQVRPDVVDICTPPKTHASIAIQAIEAGAHLLIEKPMCQTVDECDEVIEAADQAKLKICVAHSDLFYPSFRACKQLVESGGIGEFQGMHIHLSTPVDYITSKSEHWAHRLPGGVIGETGPHVVYMALSFIPKIREVHVVPRKLLPQFPWSPYEDYRMTLVGSNATATANLIYTSDHWAAEVEVWGSDGMLRADLESQTLVKHTRPSLSPITVGVSALKEAAQIVTSGLGVGLQRLTRRYVQTHQELMSEFFAAIEEGRPSPVPAWQGKESIRVMNLITDQV